MANVEGHNIVNENPIQLFQYLIQYPSSIFPWPSQASSVAPSSHAAGVLTGAWWRALHRLGDMGGSALGQRGGWGCAHHWTGEAGCFFYGNIVLGGEHRVLVPLGPPNTQYAILDKPNPYYVLCIVCYILPLIKKILNEN